MSSQPYAIDNVPQEVTNLVVTHIRVVAHTMGPVTRGGQLSQNHWSLYLVHQNGSVRLNMQINPTSNSSRGVLTVTNHGYTTVSTSAVKSWEFNVTDNLAVYYVIQLILDEGRYAYDMAEGGVGCRHWINVVMDDLVNAKYVSATSTDGIRMNDIIGYNYSVNMTPIPLEVKRGRFLKDTHSSSTASNSSNLATSSQPRANTVTYTATSTQQDPLRLEDHATYVPVNIHRWNGDIASSRYRFVTEAGSVEKTGDQFFAAVSPDGHPCWAYYGQNSQKYYWTWSLDYTQ